jgi:signal transduction histidine kinase
MSQLEAGKVALETQRFDIAALVREVCSRQQEISPRHRIRVDLAALPQIVGDLKRLDQVFTNLLSNAVKYAPDSPQIDVVGKRHGDTVTVSVTDRGRGIPADELPQLFTRYFRASTSNGIAGTGIGLNLVQELVALHGGAVAVDSTVGTGTTFTVRLPLALPASVDLQPGVALDDGATSVAA